MIAGILGFLALIPVYFVKETYSKPQNVTLKMGMKGLSKPLKLFIIISSVFALGNFSYMFFILRAQDLFSPDIVALRINLSDINFLCARTDHISTQPTKKMGSE